MAEVKQRHREAAEDAVILWGSFGFAASLTDMVAKAIADAEERVRLECKEKLRRRPPEPQYGEARSRILKAMGVGNVDEALERFARAEKAEALLAVVGEQKCALGVNDCGTHQLEIEERCLPCRAREIAEVATQWECVDADGLDDGGSASDE